MQTLKLERSMCSLDLEATGLELTTDRIVSIAILKFHPNGTRSDYHQLINPGFDMTEEAIALHGITNEMVKDAPRFAEVAAEVLDFIEPCDLVGYNLRRFDIPMLHEHIAREGFEWDLSKVNVIDVGVLFQVMDPRKLEDAVVKFCGRPHIGAHDARNDAIETVNVLDGMRQWYADELGSMSVEDLAKKSIYEDKTPIDLAGKFYLGKDGRPRYAFGRQRDKIIEEDIKSSNYGRSFCSWIMANDFTIDTRKWAAYFIEQWSGE